MQNCQLKMIAVLCILSFFFCGQENTTAPSDTIKPVFSKPYNDTVAIAIGTNFAQGLDSVKTSVHAIDNIEGDISEKIDINVSSVSHNTPGVYPVIYTVSDRDRNSASIICYVKVYELDIVPPEISFGKDTVTLNVGETYIDQIPTAFDILDGNVQVISLGNVDTSKAAIYLIKYTAKDKSNNSTTRIKTVIVKAKPETDKTKPQLSLIGDTMMCVATFTLYIEPGYIAVDNNDGIITNKVIIDYDQFKPGAPTGSYVITYAIRDSAGNSSSKTRFVCLNCSSLDDDGDRVPNVYEDDDHDGIRNIDDPDTNKHIIDTIAPVFSIPDNDHFTGNDTVSILIGGTLDSFKAEVRARDNLEGDISTRIEINYSLVSSISPGVYPITFSVTDDDQNGSTITRFVNVYVNVPADTTPPVISFGNDTVYLMVGDSYIEQVKTAFDLFEGRNVPVTSTGDVDTSKAGTYLIVYSAKDKANNSTSKTKTVIVEPGTDVDRECPVIILKGKLSMEVATFAEFIEPGYTATDNNDGDITNKVVKIYDQFKAGATPGQYVIKYSVQDSAGNSVTAIRHVCLDCGTIDVTKPVISIAGGDTVYSIQFRGKTHAVTATDDKDGLLTDYIQSTSVPKYDSTKAGIYILTYTVSDESFNIATLKVTVTVVDPNIDTTKPVMTLIGRIRDTVAVDSLGSYVDAGATANDNGKTITVQVSGSVNLKVIGSYTVTYMASDSAGNVATAVRTVVVKAVGNDLRLIILFQGQVL